MHQQISFTVQIPLFCIIFSLFFCSCENDKNAIVEKTVRPNILLIVADDLGFTDLGCYGSEIKTPNIDALAKNGLRTTSFCTAPTCSPARAMLLSGVAAHRNGFGTMAGDWSDNQKGKKGYEGHMNFDVVTFPKLMQDAGYHTSIAGKWHLAYPANKKEQWAVNRGFTKSFCLMPGGGGHFSDRQPMFDFLKKADYVADSSIVDNLPADFYSSKNYADKAIEYINESKKQAKPFFHFLSFTAPHWPLQVPSEHTDLYKGKYEEGYEMLAQKRLESGMESGIIPKHTPLPKLSPNVIPWKELSKKEQQKASKSMEIYAAMIERLDHHAGRVIDHLKEIGEYENTLIIFMADNGAEGNSIMTYAGTGDWVDRTFDNSLENMGKPNSYIELGTGWAQASSTPFRWYKAFATEGGIRVPAIFHYPKWIKQQGGIDKQFVSILDLAPTFLELAEADFPKETYEGRKIFPLDGVSMIPYLKGEKESVHPYKKAHVWELYGRRGVRKGQYKAEWLEPPYGNGEWELYDLLTDVGQQYNIATTRPMKLAEMVKDWEAYVERNSLIVPDRPTAYAKETVWRTEK